MTGDRPRFDPEALRAAAGAASFRRGLDYFREGRVHLVRVDSRAVAATVRGTEDYRVRLTGAGAALSGDCTCPAFEDFGFCKHMVATGLAANAAATGAPPRHDPVIAVRDWLAAQPPEALAALVMECAEADPALFQHLATAAARAAADPAEAAATLRAEIDAATRSGRLPGYRGVRAWARGLAEILNAAEALAPRAEPTAAFALADHILARLGKAAHTVDDSDGDLGGLIGRAATLRIDACVRLRPDPVALARDVYARERNDRFDAFHGAALDYAEALGLAGIAEYRRLAQADWDALPPRGPRDAARPELEERFTLFSILDDLAEAADDLDARIALRGKNLATPSDYVQLAAFLREAGRDAEALARAEEGLFVFEDRPPDERLVGLAADLLEAAGRPAAAEARLRAVFAHRPDQATYRRLCRLGGAAARDRARAVLEAGLPRTARLLVEILAEEGEIDRAWAIAGAHPLPDLLLDRLAAASEATHPREAIATYTARVERLAAAGHGYPEAVALIARMAALRPPAEQAAWLAGFRERFARKRTLLRLLD